MEEQKLNLNRPLLSARRYVVSPQTRSNERQKPDNNSLPRLQSQVKSGPISNAGTVPFVWEHAPGHPKLQMMVNPRIEHHTIVDAPAPKLPPGRFLKTNNNNNNNNDKLVVDGSFREVNERSKEMKGEDGDDSEEAYVDALDTLSRAEESFSMSCSTSGITSGLGSVLAMATRDREFMMDRFLPAAKAMASLETPRYALTEKEEPHIKELSQPSINQPFPTLRYGPSFTKRYSHYQEEEEEEEEEEEDDDYGKRQNLCGLLPRFCVRRNIHSLCLLNPVPANKTQWWTGSSKLKGEKTQSRKKESSGLENRDALTYIHTIHQAKMHAGTGEGFKLGYGTGVETFEEPNESSSVIEKTLYVDTVTHRAGFTDSGPFPDNASPNIEQMDTRNSIESCEKSSRKDLAEIRVFLPDSVTGEIAGEAKKGETEVVENRLSLSIALDSRQPLAPPLPKSPSDSWLWRTLPSLSARNSSTHLRDRILKAPKSEDIIVRTTMAQTRQIARYSEGPLTTIHET